MYDCTSSFQPAAVKRAEKKVKVNITILRFTLEKGENKKEITKVMF